jgi:hypothetical protein
MVMPEETQMPNSATAPSPPLLVFYDTEFTDLVADAELLSIGMVSAQSDDQLYIVIADAHREKASEFVQSIVLPIIDRHQPVYLTRNEAAGAISEWLETLRLNNPEQPLQLVSDSEWDWTLLSQLFPGPIGSRIAAQQIQDRLTSREQRGLFYGVVEAFHIHRNEQHHALVDALAIKAGYLAVVSNSTS